MFKEKEKEGKEKEVYICRNSMSVKMKKKNEKEIIKLGGLQEPQRLDRIRSALTCGFWGHILKREIFQVAPGEC